MPFCTRVPIKTRGFIAGRRTLEAQLIRDSSPVRRISWWGRNKLAAITSDQREEGTGFLYHSSVFHFSRDVYLNDERHMKYLYSIFQTSWFNFQELRSREKYMYNFNNEKLHRMCLTRSRYLIKNRSYQTLQQSQGTTYNLYNSS